MANQNKVADIFKCYLNVISVVQTALLLSEMIIFVNLFQLVTL